MLETHQTIIVCENAILLAKFAKVQLIVFCQVAEATDLRGGGGSRGGGGGIALGSRHDA